jgi:hypothetical protein
VFISHVDAALEKLVRTRLGLTEDLCDVAFEVPSTTWSAQLTRITVNLFLYDVSRSAQPSRSQTRPTATGEGQPAMFRRPQPMIQLAYLVSAWAGSPRDEHQLLSDLTSLLAGIEQVPPDLLSDDLSSSVQLALGDERNTGRELWQGAGGSLRPAIFVRATVAADTFDWEREAPAVERISAMAERMAEAAESKPGSRRG